MIGKMLGRIAWSLHNHPGNPCGECDSGHPRPRKANKRRENQALQRDIAKETQDDDA